MVYADITLIFQEKYTFLSICLFSHCKFLLNLHAYELLHLHGQMKIFIKRFNKSVEKASYNNDSTANDLMLRMQ